MPNLVATGGLTVYNITQLGAADTTGASSTFLITPNEGYFIAASQFSLAESFDVDDYAEIESINFNDTGSAFTVDNQVLVSVNWNGTTSLTEDYNIDIGIFFNNVDNVYDVNSTSVSLNIMLVPDVSAAWVENTEITILPQQSLSIPQVVAFEHEFIGYHHFNFDVITPGQTAVCDIQFKAGTGEGNRFFAQDISSLVNLSPAGSGMQGTIDLVPLDTQTDLFGNNYMYTYRLFYTRVEDSSEDSGTAYMESFNPQAYVVSNVAGNLLTASGYGHGDVIEGSGTTSGEISKTLKIFNIPIENIEFTFSDTWVQFGDSNTDGLPSVSLGANTYQYFFDVDNITSGISSRSLTVSVKDNVYNTVRRTFIITQSEVPQLTLKVLTNTVDAAEQFIDNALDIGQGVDDSELVFADTGKIISSPNADQNYWVQIPGGSGPQNTSVYDSQFAASFVYYLYAFTDTNVTLSQINNTDFNVDQVGYPIGSIPALDWLVFTEDWEMSDAGVFRRPFIIRNQDATNHVGAPVTDSVDRTATITMTHPNDVTVTQTTTIEQDAFFRSDNDTITLTVSLSTSAPFSNTGFGSSTGEPTAQPSQFGQQNTRRVYITMSDWENDFNLFNSTTTDSSETDTYKQYPKPRIAIQNSGPYTTFDNVSYNENIFGSPTSWCSIGNGESVLYVPPEDLVFNSNYNASDPDNNYQYYFDFDVYENNSFSTRTLVFEGYHSQNPEPVGDGQDTVTLSQPPANVAYFTHIGLNIESLELEWNTSPYTDVLIKFTGSTAPTVGIWDDELEQYFALAENTLTTNGFSYSLGAPNYANNFLPITLDWTENTPASDRSIQLGVWHSSLLPPNSPTDTITITQLAQPFDEDVNDVLIHEVSGFSTGDSDGGTVTLYLQVLDYDADDFVDDTNKPLVNVLRTNYLSVEGGAYEDELGNYDTDGIIQSNMYVDPTLVVTNPGWQATDPVLNIQYTHSVTIPYSANDTGSDYYFAIRARHQYSLSWQDDDYAFVTIPTDQELTIVGAYAKEYTSEGTYTYGDNLISGAVSNRNATIHDDSMIVEGGGNQPKMKIVVKYNNGNFTSGGYADYDQTPDFAGSLLYLNEKINTYFRFLSSDKTNVFRNPTDSVYDGVSQNNMPISFVTNDGNNLNDNSTHILNIDQWGSYQIVGWPSGSISHLLGNTTLESSVFPSLKFGVELNVAPNPESSSISHFIGVWKGNRAPRTNLINTNINYGVISFSGGEPDTWSRDENKFAPFPLFHNSSMAYQLAAFGGSSLMYPQVHGSGAVIELSNPSAPNLKNHIFSNNIYVPIESTPGSGVFDGFKWNHADNTSPGNTFVDNVNPRAAVRFLIHKPTSSATDNTVYSQGNFHFEYGAAFQHNYGNGKQLAISFEIEDFETASGGLPENPSVVNSSAFVFSNANLDYNHPLTLAPDGSNSTTAIMQQPDGSVPTFPGQTATIVGNGKYEFRFKSFDSFVEFSLHYSTRFTMKNLTVWEIFDDLAIRPGQEIDFSNAPDDIIRIIHQPATTTLSFSNAGINGSPMALYLADVTAFGLPVVNADVTLTNADQATVTGAIDQIQLNFINYIGTSPTVRIWDGANSSSITTAPAWIEWTQLNMAGGNPASSIEMGIANFYNDEDSTREVTFGLYDGVPSSTTTAPLDTFVLKQTSYNLTDLGA